MSKHRQMTLFMHIVDCGSISKAAEKLDLSKSVLSSALKQLEQELAVTLLKRTTRKQILTDHGERFYQHCLKMNDVVETAWQEVIATHDSPSGNLTVTAPHALMESIVAPALSQAFSHCPAVSLTLIADDHQLELMQHGIDLAIRVGESPDSNYRQRKIGGFRDVLCRSKQLKLPIDQAPYVANHWQGSHVRHHLSHVSSTEKLQLDYHPTHRGNTINQVATLISLNMGVGVVPEFLCAHFDDLEPCYPEYELPEVAIYAIHPYNRLPPQTVLVALDSIQEHLTKLGAR